MRDSLANRDSRNRLCILHPDSLFSAVPQIQGERELRIRLGRRDFHLPGRMAVAEEAGIAAAFGLVGVHREGLVAQTTRMRHMIHAATKRTLIPLIDQVNRQR